MLVTTNARCLVGYYSRDVAQLCCSGIISALAVLQCYSVAVLQCCSVTVLQCYSVAVLHCYSVTVLYIVTVLVTVSHCHSSTPSSPHSAGSNKVKLKELPCLPLEMACSSSGSTWLLACILLVYLLIL